MLPIALLFLMLQNQAPAVPAIVSDPKYPLRVQLAQTGSNSGTLQHLTAWGHGNVLGTPLQGFDYTAACNQQFAPRPEGEQYFRARWTNPGHKLEILIQELGSDHIQVCELKVALQDQPYELHASGFGSSMMMMQQAHPAVPVIEPDPNFPLRVQIWVRSAGMGSSGSHAEGYGNIQGEPPTGFDFGNTCPIRMSMGARGGDIYQGRWLEQGLRMEILVQEVGSRQENVCQMDVGLKSTPYTAPVARPRPVAPPAVLPGTRGPQAPTENSDLPPRG